MKLINVVLVILLTSLINAKNISPSYVYEAKGGVTDIAYSKNKIYVATDASSVDVFDMVSKNKIKSIEVPQMKDFMGDVIDSKIYNVDVFKGKVLFTVQASKGYREVYIYDNKSDKLKKIIDIKKKMFISKAKFVDDNSIVFALLGNEMYKYNYKKEEMEWRMDVRDPSDDFNSTFADFTLDEERKIAVVADESGDLKIVDLKLAKVIDVLANQNLDKVFKVDIKKNKIITAGQDGRCVVYDLEKDNSYFLRKKNWFLIYGAALSPKGEIGAYSSDEDNNVTLFKIENQRKLHLLTNNLMTLSGILFINEKEIFVVTDSNKFNYYKF